MCQLTPRRLPLILMSLLFLFCLAPSGHAAKVTLAWDNPGSSEVEGYNVYCGKSGTDFKATPVETITSPEQTNCPISGLEKGQTYALVATTIDGNGNESTFPDPIYYEVPNSSTDKEQIIIDNGGAETSSSGSWQESGGSSYYGATSLYSKQVGAAYSFEAPVNGAYEISLWWTEWPSRSTEVPVKVYDGDSLLATLYVNQFKNGGQWNIQGTYTFTGTARVVIISQSSSRSTCADAVKLVSRGGNDNLTQFDDDGDGYTENEGDNNDNDATIYPGAIEICGDGIDQDCDGSDLECMQGEFALEYGDVEINHEWKYIPFNNTYTQPVVVAKPVSLNGGDPAVIRIQNVTQDGFEIRIQEWEYLDGAHVIESVSFIVMESGRHELGNGINVEAGTFETSNTKTVAFNNTFGHDPVVVSSITSENDIYAVTGRLYNVSSTGFEFTLQQEEANKNKKIETVSYIAWEPSAGTVNGMAYSVDSTFNEVTHELSHISFYPAFDNTPCFIADMQTMNGGDTANIRWQNKNAQGIDGMIDEEASKDQETHHTTEVAGYIVIE